MSGHIVVYKAIDDDGNSYWPEAFPVEVLEDWKLDIGPISFASQYQSSPIDLSGNELKLEWLHFYHFENDLPTEFEKIIFFIDPAISKSNSADYFALAVAGRVNNRIYLLDLLRTRSPLEMQLEMIKDKYAIYNPDEIVIEAGGSQLYFVEYIKSNTMFNIATPDKNWHRSDKKTKFEVAAAHLNASRALIPGYKDDLGRWTPTNAFIVFLEEWTQFPSGLHDDSIDAVAGVISSLVDSTVAYSRMEPDTIEEVMEFLENTLTQSRGEGLTDEEKKALEEYYGEDDNDYNPGLRHRKFMLGVPRADIRTNRQ